MVNLVQSEELERALQEARQDWRYVHPVGRTARERYAAQKECGLLVEPYPGFFAAPEDLENLSVRAKMYRLIRTIAHQHPTWTFSQRLRTNILRGRSATIPLQLSMDCRFPTLFLTWFTWEWIRVITGASSRRL